MAYTISSEQAETTFRAYVQQRDAIRNVLAHGVYPNLIRAIAVYADFDSALTGPLNDPDLLAYHAELMAPIAPYVAQLRELAAGIVATMAAIEAASPGTFGIALPSASELPLPSASELPLPSVPDAA